MKSAHGSFKSYAAGFVLSIFSTMMAYLLVVDHLFTGDPMLSRTGVIAAVVGLGVFQLLVQLVFFLHLGRESKPRWNLIVFLFMLLVLVIIVFGSLWIMKNLNYHMTSPQDTETYIIQDEGVHLEKHE